ncbi:hypothetical protein N658DRAFT_493408 [Parathielavia hyrcaniae]|uniref:Uncharacterized protein n=1 Tax=Parathielavia hyrcaniae TaxID=113614 RepID=A0AAN6T3N3_9PEZI|nr:hypothetical protein N658DRAFT_493408 [Parathielavia hyrcaniae]
MPGRSEALLYNFKCCCNLLRLISRRRLHAVKRLLVREALGPFPAPHSHKRPVLAPHTSRFPGAHRLPPASKSVLPHSFWHPNQWRSLFYHTGSSVNACVSSREMNIGSLPGSKLQSCRRRNSLAALLRPAHVVLVPERADKGHEPTTIRVPPQPRRVPAPHGSWLLARTCRAELAIARTGAGNHLLLQRSSCQQCRFQESDAPIVCARVPVELARTNWQL